MLAKTGLRKGLAAEAVLGDPCSREPTAAARFRQWWSSPPAVKRAASEIRPRLSEAAYPGIGTPRFQERCLCRGEGTLLHQNKIILCQFIAHFIP